MLLIKVLKIDPMKIYNVFDGGVFDLYSVFVHRNGLAHYSATLHYSAVSRIIVESKRPIIN